MILRLTRGAAATNGLIAVTTDQTSTPYYGLHKPNQLEQLQLLLNSDNEIIVTLVLGQYSFSVPQVDLFIEGVQQNIANIDEIKDAFSVLFLDSSAGGGGGGTINPTDTYLPYRLNAGAFADSSVRQSIAPGAANLFKVDAGKQEVSMLMHNDNTVGAEIKRIRIGNAQPVTSPYDGSFIEMNLLQELIQIMGTKRVVIGDETSTRAGAIFDILAHITRLGDHNSTGNGTQVTIDDAAKNIYLFTDGGNCFAVIDGSVSPTIQLRCGSAWVYLDGTSRQSIIGDADGGGSGNKLVVDDFAQEINLISSTGRYRLDNVPAYATEVLATGGGLTTGCLYKTNVAGDYILKIVN